jgi:sec-independent protein translocase protein TatA
MFFPFFTGGIGLQELLVILFIVIIIFGARRLPDIGAGLGQGIRNFKKSFKEDKAIDITPEKELEEKASKEKTIEQKTTEKDLTK